MTVATKCINLRSRFPFHKIGYEDPSYEGSRDWWHKTIVCKHGHISPNGGNELLVSTDNRWDPVKMRYRQSGVTKAIMECDVCRVVQDADDGVNAVFDVKDWKEVFQLMRAIRT